MEMNYVYKVENMSVTIYFFIVIFAADGGKIT